MSYSMNCTGIFEICKSQLKNKSLLSKFDTSVLKRKSVFARHSHFRYFKKKLRIYTISLVFSGVI
jgi:hypothetical protein